MFFWEKIDSNENSKPNRNCRRPRKLFFVSFSLSLAFFSPFLSFSFFGFSFSNTLSLSLSFSFLRFQGQPKLIHSTKFRDRTFSTGGSPSTALGLTPPTSLARRFEVKKCTKFEKNKGFLAHVAKHGRVKRTSRERNQTPLKNLNL